MVLTIDNIEPAYAIDLIVKGLSGGNSWGVPVYYNFDRTEYICFYDWQDKQYQILGKRNDDFSTTLEVKVIENKLDLSSNSYIKPDIESKWIKRNPYRVAEAKLESRQIIECILTHEDSFPAELLPSILQIFLSNGFFKPGMLHSNLSINDQTKVRLVFSINCSLQYFQVILNGTIHNLNAESIKKLKISYHDITHINKNTQTLKGYKVSVDLATNSIELDINFDSDNSSIVHVSMQNNIESWILWDKIRKLIIEYINNNSLIVPNYFLNEKIRENEYFSQDNSRVPEKYHQLLSLWNSDKSRTDIAIILGIQPKTVDNKICILRQTYGKSVVRYRKSKTG